MVCLQSAFDYQGPVVQSVVSLTSSLVVKMLTVLVSTISNSQVFLLKKCEWLVQMQKLLTFCQQNISVYAIFNDQSFNDMLTNDIVSFEQLGPVLYHILFNKSGQNLPKTVKYRSICYT